MYKLIKDYPQSPYEVGQVGEFHGQNPHRYPEFFEEVKEPKSIYDLKKGDIHWYLDEYNGITTHKFLGRWADNAHISCFLTEREAKRNQLLRELATRTDKWLPEKGEIFYTYDNYGRVTNCSYDDMACDRLQCHAGFIFRNEEEYKKYITEEAKDLLFNL